MTDKPQHPPRLAFDGGSLRPVRSSDAAAIHAYLSDPVVTELTSYPEVTMPFVAMMIERYEHRWRAGELSKWGIALPDDRIVGLCGFNEWSRPHRWAEIGFDLAYEHWGTGLMRRSVSAMLQWTFEHDEVDRVHAFVRVDNRRSAGLLERLGFAREGCLRKFRVCRGQAYDYDVYALLRSEWATRATNV